MKSAIIGLGVIGKVHFDVLEKQGEDIVAVCDVDVEKLGEYEGVKKYLDYRIMLDAEKIDVVHICTPHYLHAEMTIFALQKGINVLCEKPLCISKEQLSRVLDAEKKSTAQLGVCFQNRYNDTSVFAKNYLSGKKIEYAFGSLRWHRDEAYYKSADWRGKWQSEGGGVLINQAIHTIDLLEWIVGDVKHAVGKTYNLSLKDVIEVEDTAVADFWDDACFSIIATNTSAEDMPIELRFFTKDETVIVTPDSVKINGKTVDVQCSDKWFGKRSYGNGHEKLIADFYDCVKNGKKFWIDGEEGAKALKLVLAVYECKGEVVEI